MEILFCLGLIGLIEYFPSLGFPITMIMLATMLKVFLFD